MSTSSARHVPKKEEEGRRKEVEGKGKKDGKTEAEKVWSG
jgi:hypothetical protein